MIIRNDIRPNGTVVPSDLQETLTRVGGRNVYGEPLFRLLRAEDRITKAAGAWAVWDDAVNVDDRGGLGIQTAQQLVKEGQELLYKMQQIGASREELAKQSQENANIVNEFLNSRMNAQPLRVDRGMVEVEVYPYEGWIVEKWKPAHTFGSRSEWESYRFDGQPAAGPYPSEGDYELIAGPTPHVPTSQQLEDAVKQHFRDMDDKPASAAQRVMRMVERREQEQKRRTKERKSQMQAFLKDSPASLYKTVSLGAGRVRSEMAEKLGLKGHYGN